MNRSIVIFVALAVLIAHSLAIRTDLAGDLSAPYERAYVAFRVARNLVYEGQWSWSAGVPGFESYPSTLWVLVCALAERLSLPINLFVRYVGVTASALSLVFATRFHTDRTASLITPMLLALSGAMAAAAVSGTEAALFAAIITGSFLAYENRHPRTLAVALLLGGLVRDEGWVLAFVYFCMGIMERKTTTDRQRHPLGLSLFLVPLAGFAVLSFMRYQLVGRVASVWMLDLIDVRPGEITNGLAYIRDFFVSSVSPGLIIYSFWYLLRRYLSPTGKRALVLILSWCAMIVLEGGGLTPFSESMVPILPLILIASQEGLITALNSSKQKVRWLASCSFYAAVFASALASSRPKNIGPIRMEALQRSWMEAKAAPQLGFEDQLGRQGLDEQTLANHALREIALFMRDQADPRYTVLSPWPGSLAYLSGLQVRDLLGRATPAAPLTRPTQAPFGSRVDVIAALEEAPDYIIPTWNAHAQPLTPNSLASRWSRKIDMLPGRQEEIVRALEPYEWLAIPVSRKDGFHAATILRKRSLGLSPTLLAQVDGKELRIRLEHHAHGQLVHLVVYGEDAEGQRWYLDPTGRFHVGTPLRMRSNLLLSETGGRLVQLARVQMSADPGLTELTVLLQNPGGYGGPASPEGSGSDLACEKLRISLP